MLNETATPVEVRSDTWAVETDSVDENCWNCIVAAFDDADLMQTWSYGAVRWGVTNLSHLVLKQNSEIVAAAQVVIKTIPGINAGLAYVKGGPLWQLRRRPRNFHIFRRILAELRRTYSEQRGLLLRVFPPGIDESGGRIPLGFEQEGFRRNLNRGIQRTVYLDLSHPLQALRSSLRSTWRRNLVLAEKNGLTVRHDTSNELFDVFAGLYAEMLRRKNVIGVIPVRYFQEMQRDLPEAFKMRILLCEHNGEPVSGLVMPYLGNTARTLLAATGDKGLHLRGSYLLHWRAIEWLKEHDCRWQDLDAVNHAVYPGISQFKLGLAGKLGLEAEYLGQFDSCANWRSQFCVNTGDKLREGFDQIRFALNNWRNGRPKEIACL